jgi:hypothetical protein
MREKKLNIFCRKNVFSTETLNLFYFPFPFSFPFGLPDGLLLFADPAFSLEPDFETRG